MTRPPDVRWYRRLLRLYPKDFRERFGGEMTRLYRDRERDEPWWSLWWSLIVDLVRTAPSEHLSVLRQDVRQACRSLRRTPMITATAVLTLALGVGASTAVFSVVHAVLLRPLPYPEPEDLVELFEENVSTSPPSRMRASALNYLSWTERSKHLGAIAAFQNSNVTLTGDDAPELLNGSIVTASLFRVLRVPPIVGRPLLPEDEQRASARVAVISETLWRSRFGGDPRIVGRSITLDGERHEIVGVMPWMFREVGRTQAAGSPVAQIFLPLRIDPAQENRGNHTLRVVGRIRHGVALAQARDEMRAVAAALATEFPATNARWSAGMEKLTTTTIEPHVRRSLLLVLGAVVLVFLIAGANVANLMLVRGTHRHAELVVRTALGARRFRLVRQLLTESACLAIISGAAGVLAASLTHPAVKALLPPTLPRLDEMQLDLSVLAFGMVIAMVSGIVFGVTPALRASRVDLSGSLTLLGRTTADTSRVWMRHMLIVAQIAVATMLLVCATLLVQDFVRLQHVPLGFEPDDVLTTRIALPRPAYPDAARTGHFYDRLLTTLQQSGNLQAVAIGSSAPFAPGVRASFPLGRRGERLGSSGSSGGGTAAESAAEHAAEHFVSGDYFRVLGIPLLAGRAFKERDTPGSSAVAVVSQRVARLLWPDTNPLGQMLERNGQPHEVIGIVGDVRGSDTSGARGGGPDRMPRAAVYFAASQMPQRTMTVLVRPRGEPAGITATIREAVRQGEPTLAVQPVRPLGEWLAETLAPTRLTTTLATIFAVSALVLASVGIYGVLAYVVASRTREIGVRMAIGATRGRVMRLVFGQGMKWAVSGIVLGLIGAFATARLVAAVLFDIPAHDPVTFAMVGAAMALVAAIACAVPAARAVRIDPTRAMRIE